MTLPRRCHRRQIEPVRQDERNRSVWKRPCVNAWEDTMFRKLIRFGVVIAAALVVAPLATAQASRDATAMMNDAWITTQIHAKFFLDPDIKGRNINVDTTDGVVTLRGAVHSAGERSQALAKARSTQGVARVVDKLTISPGDPPMTAEMRDKAVAALPRNTRQAKAQAKTAAARVGKEISDTWITTQVQAMYFLDRDVKGLQIGVATTNGIVTLSGAVDREESRRKAVADARSVEGVKHVVDKLKVKK
jgi:hyperosmotically inducible protein